MTEFQDHETAPSRAPSACDKAIAWFQARRFDLAEKTLREGLRETPNDEQMHSLLALVYVQVDQLKLAEDHVRQALAIAPNHPYALGIAGRVYEQMGQHQKAEEFYLQSLRRDPSDAYTLLGYGTLLYKTGHLDKAQKVVETSLRIAPESQHAHSMLAVIHSERSRGSKPALGHAEVSLSLNPMAEFSHYTLAIACLRSFRPFRARSHAREALRIDPSDNHSLELYHHCDFVCRWTYLPMYFIGQLAHRLPGQQYFFWGVAVVLLAVVPRIASLRAYTSMLVVVWLTFCVYTWIAGPITKLWIKAYPPS